MQSKKEGLCKQWHILSGYPDKLSSPFNFVLKLSQLLFNFDLSKTSSIQKHVQVYNNKENCSDYAFDF